MSVLDPKPAALGGASRGPGADQPLEAKQEIAEQSFRLFVDSVYDYGIFLLDPSGRVASWNAGAERIHGYKAEEIIGQPFSVFYPESERKKRHPEFELREAETDGRYEEEGWRLRKDGTAFWASVAITCLVDSRGRTVGFGKVIRDLTERRRAEDRLRLANESLERRVADRTRELKRANADLREAVRARDEFLGIASHELRTPITPLKIQVQSLLRYLRPDREAVAPERLHRMADTVERSLSRLERLIDSLLDATRITAGRLQLHPEETDAAELLREIVARQRAEAAHAGSEIILDAPHSLPAFLDRLRFEQVAVNLLTNAVKFGAGKAIEVSLQAQKGVLRLVVRDHGIGFRKEDGERIFLRFERVESGLGTGGLGLGLFITRQIVEALGGTVEADSRLGEGAVFTVLLPLQSCPIEGI